jgi:DNA-binding transcriptional LysR family regulator
MFAPPMPKEKTPWWLWPSLLSFNAPLVALAWLYMFAGAWQVRYLTWAAYVTLALGVWVVYVADRLLEYRLRGDGDAEMGVRHRFHARHRKKFLAGVTLASAVILLLVASNRGVTVLPDWVVREVKYSSDYVTRPLTRTGLTRRLYAATRTDDLAKPYMADLIGMAGEEARRMQAA